MHAFPTAIQISGVIDERVTKNAFHVLHADILFAAMLPAEPAPPPQPHEEPMLYCPVCSLRLEQRKCKLFCPQCGYYMSCADYY